MDKKIKIYVWKCSNCDKQVGYNKLIYGDCPHCRSRDIIVSVQNASLFF